MFHESWERERGKLAGQRRLSGENRVLTRKRELLSTRKKFCLTRILLSVRRRHRYYLVFYLRNVTFLAIVKAQGILGVKDSGQINYEITPQDGAG